MACESTHLRTDPSPDVRITEGTIPAPTVHADLHRGCHVGLPEPDVAPGSGSAQRVCPPTPTDRLGLPPAAVRKPKQDAAHKRARRLAVQRVPSVLAASTMTLVQRFVAGVPPANDLEQAVHARLGRAEPRDLQTLRCALARFDALPAGERAVLFDSSFPASRSVAPGWLAQRLGREYARRASLAAFGDADAYEEERPGGTHDVAPPVGERFVLAAEELRCDRETAPAGAGADEVGLRFLALPLLADLSTGALQTTSRRYGDVDSGETRRIDRVVFRSQAPILGVAMAVLGHELAGEEAYQNGVSSLILLFVDLLKEQLGVARAALPAAGIEPGEVARLGTMDTLVTGIAAAITLATELLVALWAPADLIIEDPIGWTAWDLVERTGADLHAPARSTCRTEGGIDVTVEPLETTAQRYREFRSYESADEASRYRIVFRFERGA